MLKTHANAGETHQDAAHPQPLVQINGGSTAPEVVHALDALSQRLKQANFGMGIEADPLDDEIAVLHRLAGLEGTLQVTSSTLPVIGGLITHFKRGFHQLVLFYVRDLAARQNAFNAQTARIVQQLAQAPATHGEAASRAVPTEANVSTKP